MSRLLVKSPIWQAQVVLNWVKSVLIQLVVKENQSILHVNCEEGIDLGKVFLYCIVLNN
jgi:hypothetical protein